MVRDWRRSRGLPEDALLALAESGYVERIITERAAKKNMKAVSSHA